jgi:hypothetical protein
MKDDMTSTHSNFILELFSCELRLKCKQKYGVILSAEHFARNYNLRSHEMNSISRETARKWLRGVSFPEPKRLIVLIDWLDIDLNSVLNKR